MFLKDKGASWFSSVWDSEQGDMAVSSWCCGSGCEDTAVQFLTGRQSQVSVINGQFRHLNSVPELAVVVTVGEPVSKQIFCFVCMIIVYTTLKTIPYLFCLYVKGKHLVHSIPMEGNFIGHIETVQFHCVQ